MTKTQIIMVNEATCSSSTADTINSNTNTDTILSTNNTTIMNDTNSALSAAKAGSAVDQQQSSRPQSQQQQQQQQHLGNSTATNKTCTNNSQQIKHTAKRTANDYRFGKTIGEGSFSSVYIAQDIHTKKEVASKYNNNTDFSIIHLCLYSKYVYFSRFLFSF